MGWAWVLIFTEKPSTLTFCILSILMNREKKGHFKSMNTAVHDVFLLSLTDRLSLQVCVVTQQNSTIWKLSKRCSCCLYKTHNVYRTVGLAVFDKPEIHSTTLKTFSLSLLYLRFNLIVMIIWRMSMHGLHFTGRTGGDFFFHIYNASLHFYLTEMCKYCVLYYMWMTFIYWLI